MDIATGECSVKHFQNGESGYTASICDGKGIWLIPVKTDKILFWNQNNGVVEKYDNFPINYQCNEWSFHRVYVFGSYIYMLPRLANMVLRFHMIEKKIEEVKLEEVKNVQEGYWKKYSRYTYMMQKEDTLYVVSSNEGKVFILKDNEISQNILKKDKKGIIACVNELGCTYEKGQPEGNQAFDLEIFLEKINSDKRELMELVKEENIGRKIHKRKK